MRRWHDKACPTWVPAALFCALASAAAGWAQEDAVTARFLNLAYAYPRGAPFVARLQVAGADEVEFDVNGWLPRTERVQEGAARYEVDTTLLRAGDYDVRARLKRAGREVARARMPLTVGPPHDAERMPVWKWGSIGYTVEELRLWKESGFTGGCVGQGSDPMIPVGTSRSYYTRLLDEAARVDFDGGFSLFPLQSKGFQAREDVRGVYANGTRADKVYPLAPDALDFARRTADTWTQYLGESPALRFLFLNSEHEVPLAPHPEATRLAQEEIGLDLTELPVEEGSRRRGRLNVTPAAFEDGVIPDDHPHCRFLKWWWERGHGTNALNAAMSETAKKRRPELITYHDPYRLAAVRHSHRGLDMISTWTYGAPDIKRLAYTTYLQAAARGHKLLVQQTITTLLYGYMFMDMTQSKEESQFDFGQYAQFGFAGFGPDYCREATWLVVSQRPDMLSYFIGTPLNFANPRLDPNVTSPETLGAITEVSRYLIQPYGPALLDSKRWRPPVALLASATGAWFHVGTYNSGYMAEQTLPYASLLMMNHTPFDVLLDDDLIEGAAGRYRALILPFSATVTQSMAGRLKEFAAAGGRVIVNEPFRLDLSGAIRTNYDFTFEFNCRGTAPANERVSAEEHRQRMEAYAADLAQHLDGLRGPVRSGTRVLSNSLEAGDVRYHFLINDDRTYGPRFGQQELWFELGLPQRAEVTIVDTDREQIPGGHDDSVNISLSVLYDAIRRKEIAAKAAGAGSLRFGISLPAGSGKLIAALPEPIGAVRLELPKEATLGKPVTLRATVLGKSGRVLRGSLPLRVDIDDAAGRRTEWSRYTTTRRAKDGVCEFPFVPAVNDLAGVWTILVTDLVGDRKAEAKLTVGEAPAEVRAH